MSREHSILAEARKLCASRQVNNQRLYFLSEMTGHSFYELKQWALVKGLEAWWTIYRRNPKYQRWHAKMDDFDQAPRWPRGRRGRVGGGHGAALLPSM